MLSVKELHLRAALIGAIRSFFSQRGFLEVDTPIRQPVLIPESHIEPLSTENWFLQTSPELCMKRLLSSGCSSIFQICRCFRKEERGRRHLEEFTMLEWYRSGADYYELMADCQQLLHHCLAEIGEQLGNLLPLAQSLFSTDHSSPSHPWQKITVNEAFDRWSDNSLREVLAKDTFEEVLVEKIEPNLGIDGPVFLYEYPACMASLAQKKKGNAEVAERFELYAAGIELANGYSELTDSSEQRLRFAAEIEAINKKSGRRTIMPEKFLADLNNLETCAGIAFGVDRLFMLLLGKDEIDDAVSFSPRDL
ncbi:EF-P lysine aminoacylase EpmA [Desulfopila inferna]|uniref:EF-P lysine aminoacylase EpmA n=1 Tax=Desulfopila inferna TaxID=468528 RepID=UPI001962C004|nr:EF-P lysine aminoacylase GenX [Desulfopila inferna]